MYCSHNRGHHSLLTTCHRGGEILVEDLTSPNTIDNELQHMIVINRWWHCKWVGITIGPRRVDIGGIVGVRGTIVNHWESQSAHIGLAVNGDY